MKYELKHAVAATVLMAVGGAAIAAHAQDKVLRVAPHADLINVDPIWTTAYITRNHGYMVYDTLFALDENFEPRAQMVGEYSISEDGLTYTFALRDGLTWHDGAPVLAEDCVASIKRWGARDVMGQQLIKRTQELVVVDDRTFKLVLSQPYALVLDSLGKISSNVPFMMPRRIAETDPYEQATEIVGSGPFRFVDEEWVPGSKVVYERFDDYVPRDEPPSFAAGGKVAKVDRVEWTIISDPQTALAALAAGEIDYYENPPADLVPVLKSSPGVEVEVLDPLGNQGWLRPNHLYPPFNHPKARQALLWLVNQEDFLRVIAGSPEYYQVCAAYFMCDTPFASDVGTEPLKAQDIEKARQLLEEAGYDGEPIVLLHPTDVPQLNAATLVTAQLLRKAGVNVDVQAMDWATLTSRRPVKDPPDQGGWNLFHTWSIGADVATPVTNIGIAAGCDDAWFGWPCDEEIERLRTAWLEANSIEERRAIADQLQARLFEFVPYVNYGRWFSPVAYRQELKGLIKAPVPFFWNIEKE